MENYAKHYYVPGSVGLFSPVKWEFIFSVLLLDSFKDDPSCTYINKEAIANIHEMLSLMKIYPINSLQDLLETLDSPMFQYSTDYFYIKEDESLEKATDLHQIYSSIGKVYESCKTPSSHIILILLPNILIENNIVVPPMQEAANNINRYFQETDQKTRIGVASEDLIKTT